jgi:hypothetical protein
MNAPAPRGAHRNQLPDRSTFTVGRDLAAAVADDLRDPTHPHVIAAKRTNAAIAASVALARWRKRAVQ